jgi:hypothetical protein
MRTGRGGRKSESTEIMTDDQEKLIEDYIAHFFPFDGKKCECDKEAGVKCKFARFTPEMWEPLTFGDPNHSFSSSNRSTPSQFSRVLK